MSRLFTPFDLGPTQLRNRIVMAPMTRNRAGHGGIPTDLNVLYYAQRATAGLNRSSPIPTCLGAYAKVCRSTRRTDRAITGATNTAIPTTPTLPSVHPLRIMN